MNNKKFLLISLAGIGDTLSIIPLIYVIRKNFPNDILDCLVMWKGSEDILKNNPNINSIIHFNMLKSGFFKTLIFCLKMRGKYDISINTYPQSKIYYRIIAWLIGAELRISHTYDNHNFLDNFLVNKTVIQDYNKHFIDNNLNLLNLLNITKFTKEKSYNLYLSHYKLDVERFILNSKIDKKILIGIHLGSGNTKNLALRRWPLDNYIKLINNLILKYKPIHILLFGGPDEYNDQDYLLSKCNNLYNISCVRNNDILYSAAIINKCNLFISVDTVFMHLAAVAKVPLQIVIKTPTFNKTVEPYANDFILIGGDIPANIYYKYDGYGIHGLKSNIINYMKSISVEKVYNVVDYNLNKLLNPK